MHLVSRFYQQDEPLRRLVRELARDPRARALDIGCKTGDVSQSLAAAVQSLVAIDPVYHDEWKGRPEIVFLAADALALPFRSGTFDVVVACECLQYMARPETALDEFHRVLKAGGALVASFPEGGPLATGLDPYNVTSFVRRHLLRAERSGPVTRHLSSARLFAHDPASWRCDRRERRGTLGFIYTAWLIDKLQWLRLQLATRSAPARWLSRSVLRPLIGLLFRAMRLDFRLRLAALSYNNVLRLVKRG